MGHSLTWTSGIKYCNVIKQILIKKIFFQYFLIKIILETWRGYDLFFDSLDEICDDYFYVSEFVNIVFYNIIERKKKISQKTDEMSHRFLIKRTLPIIN